MEGFCEKSVTIGCVKTPLFESHNWTDYFCKETLIETLGEHLVNTCCYTQILILSRFLSCKGKKKHFWAEWSERMKWAERRSHHEWEVERKGASHFSLYLCNGSECVYVCVCVCVCEWCLWLSQ